MDREYHPKQVEAINACLDPANRIQPVTGEAGTGKTYIIQEIYNRATAAGYRVALSAPTGKAAKRITESTGIRAVTNHRLLEYTSPGDLDPETGKAIYESEPRRHKTNPLPYDYLLVDEYTMVNHALNRAIIDALKPGALLREFGDMNQLQPIENSPIYKDIPSPFREHLTKFNGITLDHNYRQAAGGEIATACKQILKGRTPARGKDVLLTVTDYLTDALNTYLDLCDGEGVKFTELANQILTLGNKSWIGTYKLNGMIQLRYANPSALWYDLPRHPWDIKAKQPLRIARGDKIVFNKNVYDAVVIAYDALDDRFDEEQLTQAFEVSRAEPRTVDHNGEHLPNPKYLRGVFNGEVGHVVGITMENVVYVDVEDRIVAIPPFVTFQTESGETRTYQPQKDISLAYVLTTHKAQGSEYQDVVYIMSNSLFMLVSKKNFYTGVSRARKRVHIITDKKSLDRSLWFEGSNF